MAFFLMHSVWTHCRTCICICRMYISLDRNISQICSHTDAPVPQVAHRTRPNQAKCSCGFSASSEASTCLLSNHRCSSNKVDTTDTQTIKCSSFLFLPFSYTGFCSKLATGTVSQHLYSSVTAASVQRASLFEAIKCISGYVLHSSHSINLMEYGDLAFMSHCHLAKVHGPKLKRTPYGSLKKCIRSDASGTQTKG